MLLKHQIVAAMQMQHIQPSLAVDIVQLVQIIGAEDLLILLLLSLIHISILLSLLMCWAYEAQ